MKTRDGYTFIVDSQTMARRVVLALTELDMATPWQVDIRPYKKNRSLEQQALYRKWCRVIAAEMGMDHIELHEEFKKRWLVPILERDDHEFAQQIGTYRELYNEGQQNRAMRLAEYLKKKASTTWLNTKQFSELMRSVETFAGELGIELPHPKPKEERETE